jgi:hypothetical protein
MAGRCVEDASSTTMQQFPAIKHVHPSHALGGCNESSGRIAVATIIYTYLYSFVKPKLSRLHFIDVGRVSAGEVDG